MPQSLSRVLVHLVFSTKNREPTLAPAIRQELHPYLAGTLDHIDCPSLQELHRVEFDERYVWD